MFPWGYDTCGTGANRIHLRCAGVEWRVVWGIGVRAWKDGGCVLWVRSRSGGRVCGRHNHARCPPRVAISKGPVGAYLCPHL